jgi:hypothetical protein
MNIHVRCTALRLARGELMLVEHISPHRISYEGKSTSKLIRAISARSVCLDSSLVALPPRQDMIPVAFSFVDHNVVLKGEVKNQLDNMSA